MQLNMEQRKLIQAKPSGNSLIKGVAGSGKTTVAVNRIPFLLNHYCFDKSDGILMVTFNKTLVNYISYVYNRVEEENKLDYQSLFQSDSSKVEIVTIDSIMYKYFLIYKKENKLKYKLIPENNTKYNILAHCIAEIQKLYPAVNIIEQRNMKFLLDEIEWIKSCNYMEIEEYQNADRIGRMSKQNGDGPQKLLKNSATRKAIFELMDHYNNKLNEAGYVDFKDMSLMALKQAQKVAEKKYTHIIIDESQDLTRIQIEFLKALYFQKDYSSILFVADTAQSIYSHSWLVRGRSFTSIGFDMKGKSFTLSKNYRTTTQIAEAAYSLIEKDMNVIEDDNYVKPSLIDKQGNYPVYRNFKTSEAEALYVINEIKNNLLKKYSYKDIVIVGKTKNLLADFKNYLDKASVPCSLADRNTEDFDKNEIKLLTMHSIKGLEFKVVIIIGLNDGILPYTAYKTDEDQEFQESMERKLLYVGMTRANELLYLLSSGKPSKFISEINPKCLKLNTRCKINKLYKLNLDSYKFKNKIIDLYSNEEKIRQWIISEMEKTYHYPEKLIDVEYKVNSFSKIGYVDVVINIFANNKPVPYIFIETKAYGKGLADGINQIKSYMSNSKTCQYGIVTDGNEVVILNKDFDEIDDVPEFNSLMLPSGIETYEYLDINHNKKYTICRDINNTGVITLKDSSENRELKEDELCSLKIYSEIAAGLPIYMNSEMSSEFYLPNDLFIGKDECFMLKVKGDSMIGANVDNGDYVVIVKQQTAENRDIVAVATDAENATLKRYMKMGDSILLIPENEKYEPIQIKSEQAKILGKVIGIVKKEE